MVQGDGVEDGPHHGDHHHHSGQRLKQFLRPDGRQVHVARNPEEEAKLKLQLISSHDNQETGFDVLIHGTPQHLDALREMRAHHEERRLAFKKQHAGVYDEFEQVHADLDALSNELTLLTEKGVELDASFSRFGYDAHIRTKEAADSSSGSSTPSGAQKVQRDWEAERHQGQVMTFFKTPVIRQYFHKGLIWRASEREEVASYETFIDLIYVAVIAINGDLAARNPTGTALLQFAVTFILSWKLWGDLTLVISWFETDDIFQRLCILVIVSALLGFTTNLTHAFDSTYTPLLAFYLAQRMFQALYFVLISWQIPMIRGGMITQIMAILVPVALWIGSIHVSGANREGLIWFAIFVDLFGPGVLVGLLRKIDREDTSWLNRRFGQYFEFFPAINIEHKTERTNAFVTLVFGYSVVSLLYQNQDPVGLNAFFGKAILGLIQAFTFNWIYFEIDAFNIHVHAIRRHVISFALWMTLHLPFIMAYVLASAALAKLVLAHDCSNTDPDSLSEDSKINSVSDIGPGLRWFYSAGLGVALACMGGIAMTHEHKDIKGQRVLKRHRLAFRFLISIIMICLPLAKSLDSLRFVSITCALTVLVLCVDLYGSTCIHDSLWRGDRKCRYSAECRLRRRDIEEAVKTGAVVDVEDLAGKNLGEKGYLHLN